MRKTAIILLALSLSLAGCGKAQSASASQPENAPSSAVLPEGKTADWQAVSIDAAAFDLTGGMDNSKFQYVLDHTDTVPLDQLIAFTLSADGLSEGACEELRSRFLQSPDTVLAYLVLMGDQKAASSDDAPAAEVICRLIASADAAWHGGSEEFAQTLEACRETYPTGPAAALLEKMQAEHAASLERNA